MYIYVHYEILVKREIKNSACSDTLTFLRYLNTYKNNPKFLNLFWITNVPESLTKATAFFPEKKKKRNVYMHMKFCLQSWSLWTLWGLCMGPLEVHEPWVKNLCNKPTLCFGKIENLPLERMTV